MSLTSWKREFYRFPARSKAATRSARTAIEHSLRKWRGLLKKNLRKHGLATSKSYNYMQGSGDGPWFSVDAESCALCQKFIGSVGQCTACPLYAALDGVSCNDGGQPYQVWVHTGDARPMVRALVRALKACVRR